MKKNFQVDQGVELIQGEDVYDLHNEYSLRCIVTGTESEILTLFSSDVQEQKVALVFKAVSFFDVSHFVMSSKQYIDEMGYKSADDSDYEWLMDEVQKSNGDHIVFRFEESGVLRVYCSECRMISGKHHNIEEYVIQWFVTR